MKTSGIPTDSEQDRCPICFSTHFITKDTAKKVVGTAGMVGGAVSGIAGALQGARTGASAGALVCSIGGPAGTTFGTIAGAIFGGLIGGATGGLIGSQIGSVIDEHVLDNCLCMDCGHHFQSIRQNTSDDLSNLARYSDRRPS